jgi:Integrase core domain
MMADLWLPRTLYVLRRLRLRAFSDSLRSWRPLSSRFFTPFASWSDRAPRCTWKSSRFDISPPSSIDRGAHVLIAGMNMQTVRTAPRSPWQNAYAERVIGSIRRECLDHVIVVNVAGVRRVLTAYVTYYMQSRTHLALEKDAPISRPVMPAAVRADRRDAARWRAPPPLRSRGRLNRRTRPVTAIPAVSSYTSSPNTLAHRVVP